MKYTIITIILILLGGSTKLQASKSKEEIRKELLRELSKTQENDTMRLVILNKLVINSPNSQVEEYYIDRLTQEATKQNSKRYLCEAYLNRIIFAYNRYNVEEVNQWLEKLKPIAEKEKFYDLLFTGKRCAVDMLIVKGEYEHAEKEALKMLKEALNLNTPFEIASAVQSLAGIYRQTLRHEKAAKVLEKYYPVSIKAGRMVLETGHYLVATYSEMKDYSNQLKWLKIQERAILKYAKENPQESGRTDLWLLMNYIYYIDYYGNQKNIPIAEKYLKLANKFLVNYPSSVSFFHMTCYRYFDKTEQYDKALGALNEQMNIARELNPVHYISLVFMKADLLNKLGCEDEAITIYKTAFDLKDSIQLAHINMQTEQLKKDYDSEKLILRKEQISKHMQTSLLILIAIVLIILIAYTVHSYRIQQHLKKSEEEMRKMSHEMELANLSKERFLSNISKVIRTPLDIVVDGAKQLSLDQEMTNEERKKLANSIDLTSTGLMRLVNNILDFSRLEAGMMRYNVSEVEMVSLVHNILGHITAETGQTISTSLPETKIFINIDSNKFQSILNNLLSINNSTSERKLLLIMERDLKNTGKLFFRIEGSPLATLPQTQDIIIMNEINRMIITHFGGNYEINSEADIPFVCFTL